MNRDAETAKTLEGGGTIRAGGIAADRGFPIRDRRDNPRYNVRNMTNAST